MEHPKVASVTVTLVEATRFNYQLLSRVNDVFAKLASTRLDGDKVLECYQGLLKEKNDLASKVEHTTEKKEKLIAIVAESAKVIANLQAQLHLKIKRVIKT